MTEKRRILKPAFGPPLSGVLAAGMIAFYLGLITLTSDWFYARAQFSDYRWWITSLAAGFGFQVGLFSHLRRLSAAGAKGAGSAVTASGTLSTVAMALCCSHYLATFLPIVGLPFLRVNSRSIGYAIVAAVIIILSPLAATAYESVSSNAAGVRVDVTPLELQTGKPARFDVRLNTHSVDLSQDLSAVTELRDDKGREYRPAKWDGSPPGGHHRRGVLDFPELATSVQSVVLILRDVAGVPAREFNWQIAP